MPGVQPKHHHSDRDRIFTPLEVAQELISRIPAAPEDSWCDPCFGTGVFFDNFPTQNKTHYEIDLGRDFLTASDSYDWCVTNIPFSQPKQFIFKMAQSSRKGFGILCLANSMTATRLKQLEALGFYVYDVSVIYVKAWGFGYRTDFYVFTRERPSNFHTMIN